MQKIVVWVSSTAAPVMVTPQLDGAHNRVGNNRRRTGSSLRQGSPRRVRACVGTRIVTRRGPASLSPPTRPFPRRSADHRCTLIHEEPLIYVCHRSFHALVHCRSEPGTARRHRPATLSLRRPENSVCDRPAASASSSRSLQRSCSHPVRVPSWIRTRLLATWSTIETTSVAMRAAFAVDRPSTIPNGVYCALRRLPTASETTSARVGPLSAFPWKAPLPRPSSSDFDL